MQHVRIRREPPGQLGDLRYGQAVSLGGRDERGKRVPSTAGSEAEPGTACQGTPAATATVCLACRDIG